MAAALSGRGVHHACDADPGVVAHAHLLGGLLLPLRVSRDLHRAVRAGRGRRCFPTWWPSRRRKHLLTSSASLAVLNSVAVSGVAGLHPHAQRGTRQSHSGAASISPARCRSSSRERWCPSRSRKAIQRVDRVYFFDLLGAAGGCLALVPFLNHFGGPNTVIAASVLFAVSAAIWYNLAGTLRGRVGGRYAGAGVRGADRLQRQEPPDRYALRQRATAFRRGSVRPMESASRASAGESTTIRAIRKS